MKLTVLTDNNASELLAGEWGLSILIEHGPLRILLDAGASSLAMENAQLLGVDLSSVDFAVLSHAHYDHADGFVPLLRFFPKLRVYVRSCTAANCYAVKKGALEYIGVAPELTAELADRLVRVEGKIRLAEGVWLLPHDGAERAQVGLRERMYVKKDGELTPDDFSHEQSLVFELPRGLAIFNSCSHAGASEIIGEVSRAFPGRRIYAYAGGFHLYQKTAEEVRAFGLRLRETGVERILTGHCTGDEAFAILKELLGERIEQFRAGLETEL